MILWKPWTCSFKRDTIAQKLQSQAKCLDERKIWNSPRKWKIWSCNFQHGLGSHFWRECWQWYWVIVDRKGPCKPVSAYDIVSIHFLTIYPDLIQYNLGGGTNAPLLRCFQFICKLKSGYCNTNGHYVSYQTFNNPQFSPLLKNCFQSFHVDLRDRSVDKTPVVSVGFTRLLLMFKKASNIQIQRKHRYKMVASRLVEFPY